MKLIIRLLVNGLAVFLTSLILSKGVHIDNMWGAIIVAAVLAVLNYFVKPLFIVLTIPVTLVTFGLFLLVINALIILLASKLIPGYFRVDSFWWALLFSIVLSIINSFFEASAKRGNRENQ